MPIDGSTRAPEERTVDMAGSVLGGRYRITDLICRGGMASVFRAVDEVLPREVAVKLLPPGAADPEVMLRQRNEIDTLASLNHHALVTLFDIGTEPTENGERAFLVMELVDGPNLRDVLTEPMDPKQVALIGADLAEALHYMHGRGIVHRDIKPANILLAPSDLPDRRFRAKLADFGIARLMDGSRFTSTGLVIGTANYLSPEQASGRTVGPLSDVYSFGLVLLESLTGQQAFPGTSLETVTARLAGPPVIPGSVGPEWGALLSRMTAMNPDDRPQPLDVALAARELAAKASTSSETGDGDATVAAPFLVAERQTPEQDVTRELSDGDPDDGTGATRVLPAVVAAPPPRWGVRVPSDPPAPKPIRSQTSERRVSRRAIAVAAAALIAVGAATAAISLSAQPSTSPTPQPYPSVSGVLGTHLKQLQGSVTP